MGGITVATCIPQIGPLRLTTLLKRKMSSDSVRNVLEFAYGGAPQLMRFMSSPGASLGTSLATSALCLTFSRHATSLKMRSALTQLVACESLLRADAHALRTGVLCTRTPLTALELYSLEEAMAEADGPRLLDFARSAQQTAATRPLKTLFPEQAQAVVQDFRMMLDLLQHNLQHPPSAPALRRARLLPEAILQALDTLEEPARSTVKLTMVHLEAAFLEAEVCRPENRATEEILLTRLPGRKPTAVDHATESLPKRVIQYMLLLWPSLASSLLQQLTHDNMTALALQTEALNQTIRALAVPTTTTMNYVEEVDWVLERLPVRPIMLRQDILRMRNEYLRASALALDQLLIINTMRTQSDCRHAHWPMTTIMQRLTTELPIQPNRRVQMTLASRPTPFPEPPKKWSSFWMSSWPVSQESMAGQMVSAVTRWPSRDWLRSLSTN